MDRDNYTLPTPSGVIFRTQAELVVVIGSLSSQDVTEAPAPSIHLANGLAIPIDLDGTRFYIQDILKDSTTMPPAEHHQRHMMTDAQKPVTRELRGQTALVRELYEMPENAEARLSQANEKARLLQHRISELNRRRFRAELERERTTYTAGIDSTAASMLALRSTETERLVQEGILIRNQLAHWTGELACKEGNNATSLAAQEGQMNDPSLRGPTERHDEVQDATGTCKTRNTSASAGSECLKGVMVAMMELKARLQTTLGDRDRQIAALSRQNQVLQGNLEDSKGLLADTIRTHKEELDQADAVQFILAGIEYRGYYEPLLERACTERMDLEAQVNALRIEVASQKCLRTEAENRVDALREMNNGLSAWVNQLTDHIDGWEHVPEADGSEDESDHY